MHEALDEIYKMPLHKFRPEAILGAAHLIIGPGPCNFEIHKYRLFLESVCVGKQEIGLISDPSTKGHEIPPSSSIYTALRASFRLWVLFRLKVRHSCNFAYFVCVQRPDKGVTEPHLDQ